MSIFRFFIKTKSGILSALLILLGCTSLVIGLFSTGISFLLQLFALICLFLLFFYWVVVLSKRPSKLGKFARFLKWLMISVVIVVFILFIIVEYNVIREDGGDQEIPESAQIVIVLGCKVNGEAPSLMLRLRLEAALQRLEESPDSIAVLCGGQGPGEDITEAECMRRWLIFHGIDESRLIKEDQSENTRENVRNAAKILGIDSSDSKEAVVVTTGFHLFRSKKICNSEGFSTYGIAAKMPDLPFYRLNYYCREFASVLKMYAQEIFA